ncbi:hypothetical protein K501DRAFT_217462 [Backusella circina FSU 941]|nr:hypothetical protein K501DRAFT_217462 [Backusella circina FSU 941]
MSQQQTGPEAKALIPPSLIEFPAQRLWACSIFILLQALKAIDFFALYGSRFPDQYSGIVFKWCMIDAVFLFVLYYARIPWLQFRLWKTIVLALFMFLLNLSVYSFTATSIGAVLIKLILGDRYTQKFGISNAKWMSEKDIMIDGTHILGRHTLHILPFGTAKLNPDDEYYCLTQSEIDKKDIYIPIILNNTTPKSITLLRHDFETGIQTSAHLDIKDIQRATEISQSKNGIETYYIRIRKPGAYALGKITATDGLDVRVTRHLTYVFTCPTARFKPVKSQSYCIGDKQSLELEVVGVPPLKVEYTRKVKEETAYLQLNRIQPDVFNSPLLRLPGGLASADASFFDMKLDHDYSWAAAQQLSIKLNLTFEDAAHQEYGLVRIRDGAGNTADISHWKPQTFDIHDRPVVKFECSTTQPVDLLIGKKFVPLPLNLQGTGPLEMVYTFKSESSQEIQSKHIKLDDKPHYISAQAPGEYNLESVRDTYCQGHILHPSSCQVIQPPHPLVKVDAVPIPSECHGDSQIGMKFTAEFEGAPPYMLEYIVYKQDGRSKVEVDRKKEKVDRSRHIFNYLPKSSGEYIYEFVSLDDRRYHQLDPHVQSYKQIVHPQPDAYFNTRRRQPVHTCLGEDISVDVDLQGTGPFMLHWTLDGEKYSSQVDGYKYTIDLPPFTQPGQHVVSLVKIEDANECIKDVESRDFIVEVRRDRPTAYFYTGNNKEGVIEIQQGNAAKLPLRLSGEGPWHVTYRNVEKGDASTTTQRIDDPNAEIAVKDAGHYELLKVKDAICQGDVLPPQYLIKWLEKPTLSIEREDVTVLPNGVHQRRPVCEGINDSIDINFTGRAPFYCSYKQYRSSNGKKDYQLIDTQEITSGLPKVHLPMLTRPSGRYRYVFEKLADQQYTPAFPLVGLQVEQTVHATPTVVFRHPHTRKERIICVGDSLSSHDMDAIVLDLTGQAPFTITLTMRHASEKRGREITVDNINTNRYTLKLDNELPLPGSYQLQLETVLDANGCMGIVKADDHSSIFVKALDIATINPIEPCTDVCVGDTLDYTLSGIAPFTISYEFNEKAEDISTKSSRVSLLADNPGNLTIISVGDGRNKCRSFPQNMVKTIHPLPSSFVSGGKDVFENIHQGEMVQATIDLVGTPPFDFEWRRSELKWDKNKQRHYKGHVIESHTVYGLESHHYIIHTSIEGIIEVTSIKDRYCQYPRKN